MFEICHRKTFSTYESINHLKQFANLAFTQRRIMINMRFITNDSRSCTERLQVRNTRRYTQLPQLLDLNLLIVQAKQYLCAPAVCYK